jgi:hypothetical protein
VGELVGRALLNVDLVAAHQLHVDGRGRRRNKEGDAVVLARNGKLVRA